MHKVGASSQRDVTSAVARRRRLPSPPLGMPPRGLLEVALSVCAAVGVLPLSGTSEATLVSRHSLPDAQANTVSGDTMCELTQLMWTTNLRGSLNDAALWLQGRHVGAHEAAGFSHAIE